MPSIETPYRPGDLVYCIDPKTNTFSGPKPVLCVHSFKKDSSYTLENEKGIWREQKDLFPTLGEAMAEAEKRAHVQATANA